MLDNFHLCLYGENQSKKGQTLDRKTYFILNLPFYLTSHEYFENVIQASIQEKNSLYLFSSCSLIVFIEVSILHYLATSIVQNFWSGCSSKVPKVRELNAAGYLQWSSSHLAVSICTVDSYIWGNYLDSPYSQWREIPLLREDFIWHN